MAAAGSATNVAKEQRTVFGFSFSRSEPFLRGVNLNGCEIRQMRAGSPAVRKGFKPGWVVVAVDSLAVSTESEMRAALDECMRSKFHFYKVYCRVDIWSAEAFRVRQRKDLLALRESLRDPVQTFHLGKNYPSAIPTRISNVKTP